MTEKCPVHGIIPDCSPILNGCTFTPAFSPAETASEDEPGILETFFGKGWPDTPTVPRVAGSLDDLKVGQVVAWLEPSEGWMVSEDVDPENWDFTGTEVILVDPEPDPPVTPPAPTVTLSDEERERLETWERDGVYACPHEDECPSPAACREDYGLFAEVESILAARLAGEER